MLMNFVDEFSAVAYTLNIVRLFF